jgi:hypothetical protein
MEIAHAVEGWLSDADRAGELRGLRAGLARLLEVRSITLGELARARVDACDDASTLARYLQRATTATCEADVFDGGNVGERFVVQGFAQGFAASRPDVYAPGLQLAIGTVLGARITPLSEAGRARVTSCADVATLLRWLGRALKAASEGEVFMNNADDSGEARN